MSPSPLRRSWTNWGRSDMWQAEQVACGDGEKSRRHRNADSGQKDGGGCGGTKGPPVCGEAAIEQDDGEGDAADKIGYWRIVELDAKAILADQQAKHEEDQKEGGSEPERDQACEDRDDEEPCANENDEVHHLDHRLENPLETGWVGVYLGSVRSNIS